MIILEKFIAGNLVKCQTGYAFSKLVPNIDLFIQLHVTKEAAVSSSIEGTQTQMDEDEISPERKNDWVEVSNYIKALNQAITELEELPISSRLIKKTHQILLDSARGKNKQPGAFRTSQNSSPVSWK